MHSPLMPRHSCLMPYSALSTRHSALVTEATLRAVLLALFLIDLAAGLYLFLPFVGRRNAGVKFYRLVFITSAVLAACAAGSHALAGGGGAGAGARRAPGAPAIVFLLPFSSPTPPLSRPP